jgi:hypothetical protein
MSPPVRGFGASLFGVRLAVISEADTTADVLERYLLQAWPRTGVNGARADRVVEVRHALRGDGLEILVDGDVAGEAPDPLAAIAPVQRALDDAVVRGQAELAVVHGGVVAADGRAIVLPGSTGAGKSALVAELVRQGATYFSDEYAFIDRSGLVHPYPRSLLLRDASGAVRPRLPADLGGPVGREPIPAGLIIGLRYAPGASTELARLSQGEAVLLLLRNTPQVLVDQPWILAPLERAVSGSACYAGRRGAASDAAAAILRLARSAV